MSYVRIWVHAVFSTRNREAYFTSAKRAKLIEHIKKNCRSKRIFVDSIGGWSEHLHILISLGREQSIAKTMMLIKGESAHWLNRQNFFEGKFYWQDDYYAISVSESQVENVRAYIAKQEEHHQAKPFEREIETLERINSRFGLKPADFLSNALRWLKPTAIDKNKNTYQLLKPETCGLGCGSFFSFTT